jgi:uncharacterized delta-60 repeat protein
MDVSDMATTPDGRVFVFGVGGSGCAIAVVRADGTGLDTTVGSGTGMFTFSGLTSCRRILVQNDGKILFAGAAYVIASSSEDMAVGRILADLSSLDPQFNGGQPLTIAFDLGGENVDHANAIALQPDGRIVIAGDASTAAGAEPAFARLLPDGKFDNAVNDPDDPFGPTVHDGRMHLALSMDATLNAIALDRAGNIIFGGAMNSQWLIGRLLRDGSGTDPAFNGGSVDQFLFPPGTSGGQEVEDIALQSDSRILATGYFPRSDLSGFWFGVTRLTANGSFDTSFGIAGFGTGTFTDGASNLGKSDVGYAIAIGDHGIIVAGRGEGSNGFQFGVARVQLDLIFEGTFD